MALPDEVSPPVKNLLEEIQDHIANAGTMDNILYSPSEVDNAISLMDNAADMLGEN